MQPSLSQELRQSADSLLEFIQRQSPEITGVPRRIQVAYEAADELVKLRAERDGLLTFLRDYTQCDTCLHEAELNKCPDDIFDCQECREGSHAPECYCRDCTDCSKWEWKGMQEAQL